MGVQPAASKRSRTTIGLAAAVIVLGGLLGYTYYSSTNQNAALQSSLVAANFTAAAYNSTIADLRAQIRTDVTEIMNLQSTIQSAESQIAVLQSQIKSQISSLQAQLTSLQAASLEGSFTSSVACPLFEGCSYSLTGAYANYGINTATSASVTFTFYSDTGGTGQVLCTTTVALGDVPGRSIGMLPATTCNSTSNGAAKSMAWKFAY